MTSACETIQSIVVWATIGFCLQITFNGGSQWSELQKPATYKHSECNGCRDVPDAKCKLHLHGPTGWVDGPGDFPMPLLGHVHIDIHIHMDIHVHMDIHMDMHMHVHIHQHPHIHLDMHMHVCTSIHNILNRTSASVVVRSVPIRWYKSELLVSLCCCGTSRAILPALCHTGSCGFWKQCLSECSH